MNSFTATVESTADISAARPDVWAVISDPSMLPKLTPLLDSIDADGDHWTWHMIRISALGVSIDPSFTEKMTLSDPSHLGYTHEPPTGVHERAAAEGRYDLTEIEGGTRLDIVLAVTIEVPLPRRAAKAVERVMHRTMTHTGDKFSANLLQHLNAHVL